MFSRNKKVKLLQKDDCIGVYEIVSEYISGTSTLYRIWCDQIPLFFDNKGRQAVLVHNHKGLVTGFVLANSNLTIVPE